MFKAPDLGYTVKEYHGSRCFPYRDYRFLFYHDERRVPDLMLIDWFFFFVCVCVCYGAVMDELVSRVCPRDASGCSTLCC
jgi:hypothetical protein